MKFESFYLRGYHGRYLTHDDRSPLIQQRPDVPENSRLVLIRASSCANIAIVFSQSKNCAEIKISGRDELLQFHTFLISLDEDVTTVTLQDPLTSLYLRSIDIQDIGVDLGGTQSSTWESFSLEEMIMSKELSKRRNVEQLFILLNSTIIGTSAWIDALPKNLGVSFELSVFGALADLPWTYKVIIDDYISSCNNAMQSYAEKFKDNFYRKQARVIASHIENAVTACTTDDLLHPVIEALLLASHKNSHKNAHISLATALREQMSPAFELRTDAQMNVSTYVNLTAGLKSSDGSTILGGDGHMFLIGGSNDLLTLYKSREENLDAAELIENWSKLFSRRSKSLDSLETKFIQIIIPEKPTALRHLFPIDVPEATYTLLGLEALLEDEGSSSSYLSIRKLIKGAAHNDFFKRVDTHLQPRGAFEITSFILNSFLGITLEEPKFNVVARHVGDLSYRFFGDIVIGSTYECVPQKSFQLRTLLEEVLPAPGRHIGQRSVWENLGALVDLKVVAFGNSFFGSCHDQGCLGWWFSGLCKEFHHVWSPSIDYDYVEKIKPDLVICQTAERFLSLLPSQ